MIRTFSKHMVLTLAGFALGLTPLHAQGPQVQCPAGNATMNGVYVMSGSGTIVGVGPIVTVGMVTYDGQGGATSTSTTSVNGNISRGTSPGTFAVNRDCTGTKTFGPTNFDFVITPDGSKITWIITNPGAVVTGTAVRVR